MENPYKEAAAQIAARLRANPEHICRWVAKEEELFNTSKERFRAHREFYSEDFVFAPSEDIMVYADFLYFEPLKALPREFKIYPLHRHEFFELLYVYSGECKCFYGDEAFTLTAGELWIFNTACRHGIELLGDDALVFNINVRRRAFSGELSQMLGGNDLFLNFFLNSLYNASARPSTIRFKVSNGDEAQIYIYKILCEYYGGGYCSQTLLKLSYAALLIEIARKYRDAQSAQSTSLLPCVIAYISKNAQCVTLDALSKEFHYCKSYLSRLIVTHTGMNFSDCVRSFRLEKAAHMLTHSALSIESIAAAAGYSARSSFEKEFKKYTSKTPCEYRKGNA